jgi:non-specific serine/threonine protein kinase
VRAGAPVPLTSFVGRRRELQVVRRLLPSARLLTLVGPGGCGKTRLAIEIARNIAKADVAWVDLAQLRRPDEIQPSLAQALGIGADPTRMAEALATRLNDAATFVVLDNCDHLLGPAAEIALNILASNEHARVLATSREALDAEGELIWRVPPLSVPLPMDAQDPPRCMRSDAVKLFVERARLVQPGFVVDESSCPHVVAICRAVDGLPLAIELAAARLRHASVAELAARVDELLALLVGKRRAGDPRHRAMRAALDWSRELLDEPERRVFRRLAIFAGGFRLSAAQAVCADIENSPLRILDLVASLVDRSLVAIEADGERYHLLAPIREYALEWLRASDEEELVTERCARYFAALVATEIPDDAGTGTGPSITRVREEFANITATLPWLVDHDPRSALGILGRFGRTHWTLVPIHRSVVNDWLGQALAVYSRRDAARVQGLLGQATLTLELGGDRAVARRAADEALAIARELGDPLLEAFAHRTAGSVAFGDDIGRALQEYDAAISMLRAVHPGFLAMAQSVRSVLRQLTGDPLGAQEDLVEAFATWDRHDPSSSLRTLTLMCAADVAYQTGGVDVAEARLREAVSMDSVTATTRPGPIELLAHLAAVRRENERALRLSGFADRLRDETGLWPSPFLVLSDRSWLPELERRLGPRARELRTEGRRLTNSEGVAYALEKARHGPLSAQELAVAELVARGFTDRETAVRLGISERTAENHVQHVRVKLKVRSRAQIGRWLAEHSAPPTK